MEKKGMRDMEQKKEDFGKTVKLSAEETTAQPEAVCQEPEPFYGWLVCTRGPHMFQEFRLKGINSSIGRQKESDISLEKDSGVSRKKHAVIFFEKDTKKFQIGQGESQETVYVNGVMLLGTTFLRPYDRITVGSSELLFIPLCSEKFMW